MLKRYCCANVVLLTVVWIKCSMLSMTVASRLAGLQMQMVFTDLDVFVL